MRFLYWFLHKNRAKKKRDLRLSFDVLPFIVKIGVAIFPAKCNTLRLPKNKEKNIFSREAKTRPEIGPLNCGSACVYGLGLTSGTAIL